MARQQLSEAWTSNMAEKISEGLPIDVTIASTMAAQFIVVRLSKVNRPFKIHNLGAGVKRITTDTVICPCCKKML